MTTVKQKGCNLKDLWCNAILNREMDTSLPKYTIAYIFIYDIVIEGMTNAISI